MNIIRRKGFKTVVLLLATRHVNNKKCQNRRHDISAVSIVQYGSARHKEKWGQVCLSNFHLDILHYMLLMDVHGCIRLIRVSIFWIKINKQINKIIINTTSVSLSWGPLLKEPFFLRTIYIFVHDKRRINTPCHELVHSSGDGSRSALLGCVRSASLHEVCLLDRLFLETLSSLKRGFACYARRLADHWFTCCLTGSSEHYWTGIIQEKKCCCRWSHS